MFLLFFFVWIIFNGAVTAEIVIFGLVIALIMFGFICKFMDYSLHKEVLMLRRSLFFFRYLATLLVEIVKANMAVIHLILTDREVPEPVIVTFHTSLKSKMARMILANSITLTPGTITIALEGQELIVHCLDKTMAEGMADSVFVRMLEKMEGIGE